MSKFSIVDRVLDDGEVRRLRLRSQRLFPERKSRGPDLARLVRDLCGVQAQYPRAAALTLRARSHGLTAGTVSKAIEQRTIVRTWCMRGTLHLVEAGDVLWLAELLAPTMIAGSARRFAQLGLDVKTALRAAKVIEAALSGGGPMTRAELFAELQKKKIDTAGQRGIHLLWRAAMMGIICMGPDRGGKGTYVLIRDWLGEGSGLAGGRNGAVRGKGGLAGDQALAELARRYLEAYGPAAPGDLAAWSGLSVKDAKTAWKLIASELIELHTSAGSAWLPAKHRNWLSSLADRHLAKQQLPASGGSARNRDASTVSVRLLPGFDIYLLGYRDRAMAVESQYAKRINAGGGILKPTLIVDGKFVATWQSREAGKKLVIEINPFGKNGEDAVRSENVRERIEDEVSDIGRFLGIRAVLQG